MLFRSAYETVGPAVASVIALRKDGKPAGQGSGVVFTPDGYVLTNSHVAAGEKDFLITLPNGLKGSARMVGDDPETDLAVVRMSANGLDYAQGSDRRRGFVSVSLPWPLAIPSAVRRP